MHGRKGREFKKKEKEVEESIRESAGTSLTRKSMRGEGEATG